MKTKTYLLFLFIIIYFQSCNAQQAQTVLPKVENQLKGSLDHAQEALELVQMQANGDYLSLGKIEKDSTIHFDLPEYDIKSLFEQISSEPVPLPTWFEIDSECKDRDVFAETPFDHLYSLKTKAIWIKKYGIRAAILESASVKKKVRNHNNTSDSLAVFSTYSWFYVDRAIAYTDNCTKISHRNKDVAKIINANISFNKGWNFIEEKTKAALYYDKSDVYSTQLMIREFTNSSPKDKNVKWSLRQVVTDDKLKMAKRLHNLTPLTKEQFEKWMPNKIGDLSVTTNEYGTNPKRQKNKNNIHVIYADKTLQKVIDLYVVDFAKSPDDLEMINFAYAMENRNKEEKDIKPFVAQYNEQEKATQLLYKVEDRIFVTASSASMNGEELWGYVQKLNVEKLLKK